MWNKSVRIIAIAALIAAPVQQARAQMGAGYTDVGVTLGFGTFTGSGLPIGGRFEKILQTLPSLGNGLLGVGVGVDHYGFNHDGGDVGYTNLGATANYHFKLDDTRFDLFAGAGLGLHMVNCGKDNCGYSSGLFPITRLGGRYFMQSNIALYGDAGYGAAALNLGVTFKLK